LLRNDDHRNGIAFDTAYWARNLREPVLFSTALQRLIEDGHEIFKVTGQLALQGARPGRPMTAQTVMDINHFQIPRPGTYSFEIFIDNRHQRSVALHVVEAESKT
jgi:acyl transferase domain-containing protein